MTEHIPTKQEIALRLVVALRPAFEAMDELLYAMGRTAISLRHLTEATRSPDSN